MKPFYSNWISLESNDKSYCNTIKSYVIKKLYNNEFEKDFYLFGSTAKGTCTEKSDIDILVKFNTLDVNDISNSALIQVNSILSNELCKYIQKLLGVNPITNKKFEIQIVGAYELRFFPKDKIKEIMDIKIKL